MKSKPLISVIIPIFNTEKYISECLDSIVSQTYKNLEIILVNDNSTDRSGDICEEYQKKDERVKYLKVNNGNAALTRQNGVNKSAGELICFCDADDIVSVNYIEAMYEALKKHNVKVACCGLRAFNERSEVKAANKERINSKNIKNDAEFFFSHYRLDDGNCVLAQTAPCKLISRDLFKNIDYSVLKTKILEDNFIIPQVLVSAGEKIAIINNELYYYRIGHNSTMSDVLSEVININNKKMTFIDLFDTAMKYIANIYDVDFNSSYINELRAKEFYLITKGLENRILALQNSQSYKIGRKITTLYRVFRKKQ